MQKSNVGIFLGYSSSSKAYRVFNKKTMICIKGEKDMHQVLKENATFISFFDACLMC